MSSGTASYDAISEVGSPLLNQEMEMATQGLEPYYLKRMKTKVSKGNAPLISNYVLSVKVETNLSDNHRRGVLTSFKLLSAFYKNKPFGKMTIKDALQHLDSLRNPEQVGPLNS